MWQVSITTISAGAFSALHPHSKYSKRDPRLFIISSFLKVCAFFWQQCQGSLSHAPDCPETKRIGRSSPFPAKGCCQRVPVHGKQRKIRVIWFFL
jgi:hypothetical protein